MHTPQRETTPTFVPSLGAVLAAGLVLRLLLLLAVAPLDTKIVDEQHYRQLAASVLHGEGFAWAPGRLTSLRPPLYPFLVAGTWWLTGTESLQWVRIAQIALSLLNVLLVYRLGVLLYGRTTALLAAAMFCFYPTLVFFDYLILTEVLFTFLLTVAVLGYIQLLRNPKVLTAWCTGAALGFASLTRSILWPLPLLLCPFALVTLPGSIR